MQASRLLIVVIVVGGCGQVAVPKDDPVSMSLPIVTTTTVAPAMADPTTTTAPGTTRPSQSVATTTTTRRAVTTTVRPATTTTARPLTRAEANAGMCAAIESADAAVQAGRFVAGGLKLGGALSAYEKAAEPAVVAAARSMLRAGLAGDPEAYLDARQLASSACAQVGVPIQLSGGIRCVSAPCP